MSASATIRAGVKLRVAEASMASPFRVAPMARR
jgi:hypothetical protein